MPYTKKYFIEITSLDKISDEKIFMALKKNFDKTYIKLYKAELLKRDI